MATEQFTPTSCYPIRSQVTSGHPSRKLASLAHPRTASLCHTLPPTQHATQHRSTHAFSNSLCNTTQKHAAMLVASLAQIPLLPPSLHVLPQPCHIQRQRVGREPGSNRQQWRPCCCCQHTQLPLSPILCQQQACQGHHLLLVRDTYIVQSRHTCSNRAASTHRRLSALSTASTCSAREHSSTP